MNKAEEPDQDSLLIKTQFPDRIAGIYGAAAVSCAMIAAYIIWSEPEEWLHAVFPIGLAIHALYRGLKWRFNPSITVTKSQLWHRAVWLNLATAIWAIVHVLTTECTEAEAILIFCFISYTQLALCTALFLVPSAMTILLFIGTLTGFVLSVVDTNGVPLPAVVMYVVTGTVLRKMMTQHKTALIDSRLAHGETLAAMEKLDEEKQRVHNLAYKDSLTGLNNRRSFLGTLADWTKPSDPNGLNVLLLFDLNGFKKINDTAGHAAGDAALCEIARRLCECLNKGEFAARLGGDEFGALIHVKDLADLQKRRRITGLVLNGSFTCAGKEFTLSAACGYAIIGTAHEEVRSVMKRADYASYKAKTEGLLTSGHLFSAEDAAEQIAGLNRTESVELLVAEGGMQCVFQPIVFNGKSGKEVFGYEVLSRWPQLGGGFVSPPDAMKIIDDLGKPVAATRSLLEKSIAQRTQLPIKAPLFFNFSMGQFRNEQIWKSLPAWLDRAQLCPMDLVIEINEEIVVNDLMWSMEILKSARERGIRFALDDFGSGNTGLALLADYKFEFVKIDKVFFARSKVDPASRIIVSNLVRTCMSIGSQVIVEGIETEEDFELAKALGVGLLQGYYFGKPEPAAKNRDFLSDGTWSRGGGRRMRLAS